jgi:DNA-binding protein HU-beta
MNQSELTERVAARLGGSHRDADAAVRAVLGAIQDNVAAGHKITVTGFGVFEKLVKPPRVARNPANGQQVQVPERAIARFRVGSKFAGAVKEAHTTGS